MHVCKALVPIAVLLGLALLYAGAISWIAFSKSLVRYLKSTEIKNDGKRDDAGYTHIERVFLRDVMRNNLAGHTDQQLSDLAGTARRKMITAILIGSLFLLTLLLIQMFACPR
jgi:hypothetical protein